ncbi:MAG: DMT family transporter [Blastocatellia bacterium]|nr:DMT family transporter [Blastocatellia bacterium]MCS7156532.1 DMT family transporter [Blastocatellia bacterium]MCX7751727.1 DMT family transporter [Blastocatellia bacterium]MDW8168828.1 DMT family transporter [Acidobacteriota bacterium]MDW8257458.1 DMT family transporter [Acidobacteriota bacterium]
MRRSRVSWVDGLLLLMSTVWAINFTVVKIALHDFSPLSFNALRFIIASLALVLLFRMRREAWAVESEDLGSLIALGILANTIYQIAFIEGLARSRASTAALILATTPMVVALLSAARGQERVTGRMALGIGLSFLGIAFIIGEDWSRLRAPRALLGADGSLRETAFGDLLLLVATVCWSFYTIGVKRHVHRYGAVKSTLLTMIAGTIPLVLVSLPALREQSWTTIRPMAWAALLFSALGAIVFCFIVWNYSLKRLGSTRTAIYSNLSPAIALLVAWIGLNERPSPEQLIGAAMILLGISLARTHDDESEFTIS